jgi:glutamyl-Q tRNA(Asp) synthetase
MITRFAPSPTGHLHLGHAAAASKAFGFAKDQGATCLLRIEDIDAARCRSEYTQAIYEDIDWLGFSWLEPVRIQSEHMNAYAQVLENLKSRDLVYACFLTRKDIARNGITGPLSKNEVERRIAAGEAPAWRLSLPMTREVLGASFDSLTYEEHGQDGRGKAGLRTVIPADFGDIILARKDIGTSYHLACCHDDALQNVTDIVRGTDLAEQTGVHVLLQKLMDWPTPRYHHHGLILKGDGEKLSKRTGDTSIRSLRQSGTSAKAVLDMAKAAIYA